MIQNTKIQSLLRRLGLSQGDITVYLYLLSHGASSATDIARRADKHRPAVYAALASLMQKGLVSTSPKGARTLYMAQKPDRLRALVTDLEVDLNESLSDLEALYGPRGNTPVVRMLEGKNGISQVFSDIVDSLEKGDVFYRYTSETDLAKVNSYLPRDYRKKRDGKKLERMVISNPVSGTEKKPRLERFIKYLGQGQERFEQNIIELIYGTKVAFIDLNSETTLVIENKALADFQKTIFTTLYAKL